MSYPFPAPYPTLRECPKCLRSLRLVEFRRWDGEHRTLHDTCNACDPEKPLEKLDVYALHTAVRAKRISDEEAERLLALRAKDANRKRAERLLQRNNKIRMKNWQDAFLGRLASERDWARSSARSAKHEHTKNFFRLYLEALQTIIGKVHAYLRMAAQDSPKVPPGFKLLEPPPELLDPLYYFDQDPRPVLRVRLSICPVTRVFLREPWFLEW